MKEQIYIQFCNHFLPHYLLIHCYGQSLFAYQSVQGNYNHIIQIPKHQER